MKREIRTGVKLNDLNFSVQLLTIWFRVIFVAEFPDLPLQQRGTKLNPITPDLKEREKKKVVLGDNSLP